jgi:Raf kinase inhibitor-like YbhB/YbcL family protein
MTAPLLATGAAAGEPSGRTRIAAADAPAAAKAPAAKKSKASKLALVSPDIGQGKTLSEDQVFNGFGCKGKNLSPELHWSGAPEGTKSFAVMVYDPDAPTGSGFWHWVVYDIPADVDHLPAEAGDPKKPGLPKGAIQGRTDFGIAAYGGPCPPPGKPHHYHFMLFALKVPKLQVPADATAAMIGFYVNTNKLAEAELVGLYGR